jgi:hypothetical protein
LGWEKVLPPETDALGGWVPRGKEKKKNKKSKKALYYYLTFFAQPIRLG